jgi:phosphoenolpyruvate phosphomutase
MKEAQRDPDFVVVARVEALIAGHGMEEAIKRGEEYRKAGADAVLIHSSKKNAAEILAFKKEWGDRLPLVIVPTKYYTTPTEAFREAGFKIVIWANHLMRSALAVMQATAKQIFQDQSLMNVEERVAPLAEVFRLQGEHELERAEKAYLPRGGAVARGIVLAAGRGDELGELTKDRPKCMVPIGGKPILGHIMDAYRSANVRRATPIAGSPKSMRCTRIVARPRTNASCWSERRTTCARTDAKFPTVRTRIPPTAPSSSGIRKRRWTPPRRRRASRA